MTRWVPLAILVGLALALPAAAQDLRPGDTRPELPVPAPPVGEDDGRLDLPDLPPAPAGDAVGSGLAVRVERFEVEGCTAFTPEQLGAVLGPWVGRSITSEELLAARDAVTGLYREAGYATSGAVIPDQDVASGVVRIVVVEGALGDVSVRGADHFRERYFADRVRAAAPAPVAVADLERALRLIQRDPWVRRVDAKLVPGERFGESRLELVVEEEPRWQLSLVGSNENAPTVGSWGPEGTFTVANLVGMRDVWSVNATWTEGLRDVEARVEVPITPWDTRFGFRFRDTHTEIIERPFDDLDIEADSRTYALWLAHPIYRQEDDEIWLELIGEHRQTESEVLGEAFCFELEGSDCEEPTTSILRTALQWTRRSASDVVALRSQLSVGIDVLDASTDSDRRAPDGRFVAWLAQAQWAHVMSERFLGTHAVLRGDVQLSNDPLLSIERFAMGGLRSVRGYRENQLVRDSGYTLSGELRIPVWRDSLRRHVLEVVPFMDFAQGWNEGRTTRRDELWGVGAGLRFMPREGIVAEAYWAGKLTTTRDPNRDLQDDGIHLRIQIDAPDLF